MPLPTVSLHFQRRKLRATTFLAMRILEKGVAGGVEREERNVEEKYQYKGEWLDWKLGNKPN